MAQATVEREEGPFLEPPVALDLASSARSGFHLMEEIVIFVR